MHAGQTVGRYEIISVLGQGGFGITYRARDTRLDREVAIKEYLPSALAVRQGGTTVLPRSTDAAEDFSWGRERFVAEGRTLASLEKAPAIVRVFDFLEANGTAYIVMELVRGETVERRLKRAGRLSPPEVERILWPLLDGLERVHGVGFLHRDIKPANILLDDAGAPTLIDFGASRAAMIGRSVAMTAIFTPGFAAAEQFTAAKQGPWTDIYGLSATLYSAITGNVPPSAFDRMLEDNYQPLATSAHAPGFAPALLAGIDAGLAVRASERPQSIAAWRESLTQRAADDGATVVLRRPPPAQTAAPKAQPRRTLLYSGIALVLLALGGAGYFLFAGGSPRVALQDMKVEDLEKALEARRKADAEAAEKLRVEEEAQKKATANVEAQRAAEAALAKAQQEREKAEADLARIKAELEAQKKAAAEQADAVRRVAAEEAQRKAEAEAAERRQVEEEARKKASEEAEARRKSDAELARAQAEREQADRAAKVKAEAEAKQKAEADAKVKAEAEARAKEKADAEAKAKAEAEAKTKAEAEDKKKAEAAEGALKLAQTDRQRLQIALTSQGFDTRGSDGAFGPRTREMVAAWQKARNQPATGFVDATQQQQLLREAAAALQKYDDEQKKAEEDKKKAEEEAKAKAGATAAFDGDYGGVLKTRYGDRGVSVKIAGGAGSGATINPGCGNGSLSFSVAAGGEVSGKGSGFDPACNPIPLSISGKVAAGQFQMTMTGNNINVSATLLKGAPAPTLSAAPAEAAKPSDSDGAYGGSLTISRPGGKSAAVSVSLTVSAGSASGRFSHSCGSYPVNLRVSPEGKIAGDVTMQDGSESTCFAIPYSVSGSVRDGAIELDMRGAGANIRGSLRRGAAAAAPATPAAPAAPSPSGGGFDGSYGGGVALSRQGVWTLPASLNVSVAGPALTGQLATKCGNFPVSFAVSSSGEISGSATMPDGSPTCATMSYRATGRIGGDTLELSITAPGSSLRAQLKKGVVGAAPSGAPEQAAAAPSPSGGGLDGAYGGTLTMSRTGGISSIATANLAVSGGTASGQVVHRCGSYPLSLSVAADGKVSGNVTATDGSQSCATLTYSVSGSLRDGTIDLDMRGAGSSARGSLRRGVAAAAPPPAAAPPSGGPFDGAYTGTVAGASFAAGNVTTYTGTLTIRDNQLTGNLVERRCGAYPITASVSASGELSGQVNFAEDAQCGKTIATIKGQVSGSTLKIEFQIQRGKATGSLTKTGG